MQQDFIPQEQYGFLWCLLFLETLYLLLICLMKPYQNINDPGKRKFSYKLSSRRMIIECMFGRLPWEKLWMMVYSNHTLTSTRLWSVGQMPVLGTGIYVILY